MELVFSVFVILFGTIIGSFLNVVALRHNTGMGLHGRSKCFTCGTTLTWKELVPVLSFLIQGGKCKTCRSSISYQYPIVEAVTGATFWLIAQTFLPLSAGSVPLLVLAWIIASLFIVISVHDLRHTIIPDEFVGVLVFFGLIRALTLETRWEVIGTGLLLSGFFAAIWHFSHGRAMGLGDAKLTLAIGWLLNPVQAFTAVTLAVWIAAAVGIGLLVARQSSITMKTEMPFGPFLALGALIVYASNFSLL